MYLHEALMQPDKAQFLKAMIEEVEGQTRNKNWIMIERTKIPKTSRILPCVWAMRRKRRILDGSVYKWKARLNVDGGKQIRGVDYWETYAPVATWITIRIVLIMAIKEKWCIKQLDFVQAYPQAPVEAELYIELPKGFVVDGDRSKYALKVLRNVYGQKQAGRVWNQFLVKGLLELGFHQSEHDMCLFWRKGCIIVIYTDDTIVIGPNAEDVNQAIELIKSRFNITSNDKVGDFLGVNISYQEGDAFTLSQPHLIKSIISDLGLTDDSKTKPNPAVKDVILQEYKRSPPHCENWSYRSVIGKLNYLEKCSRPDISYAVHQCACFSKSPKIKHMAAVKRIGRYLLATADKGIICQPNNDSITCYADASFAGEWDTTITQHDPNTARSRSGFVVKCANCPIIWSSKLQSEFALSATEAEYVALSQSLREVIPTLDLLSELKESNFTYSDNIPSVHCKAFEDNIGAVEMARLPKMRPRTKHINIKYHHFRGAVEQGLVTIHHIRTNLQLADIFTKPLTTQVFEFLRGILMGW
jgi:Reverse transcriptase (RNA-dependent DNA polymerase)